MNLALISGIGLLVLLFGGIYAVAGKVIGWWAALAVYGLTAAILGISGLAAFLINAGTQ